MADCIGCGSDRREVVAPNGLFPGSDIARCLDCGLIYPWPRPTEEAAARFYRDSYYSFGGLIGGVLRRLKLYYSGLRARNQHRWIVARLALDNPGRVLELGSGYGRLLELFHREGWSVAGIEPSRDCAEYTRRLFADSPETVFHGTFEHFEARGRLFDLIILSHVFEHFVAPEAVIERLAGMLAPSGRIFFELPNGDCPHYRETKFSRVPDFYFFNSRNFERFARAHGLESLHSGHVDNRWLVNCYSRACFAVNYIWWAVLDLFGVPCFRDSGPEALTFRAIAGLPDGKDRG